VGLVIWLSVQIVKIGQNSNDKPVVKPFTPAIHTPWVSLLLDSTGATYDAACVVWGHSPVDIDSHKLSSWKVVHQCVLRCSHWWTTFQLLSLWLSMSKGLWPQTVKRHMRRHKSPVGSSRFHEGTKFNRQLYQCNDCNGRFTTLQSLRDHIVT